MLIPTIYTKNLILRPLFDEDAHAIFAYAQMATTTQFTQWKAHKTIADTQHFIAAVRQKQLPLWAITLNSNSALIGECGITLDQETAELHCALSPTYWGQGLAHEALTKLIEYSFDHLKIKSIQVCIVADNARSIALAKKLGLQEAVTLRKQWLIGTTLHDVRIFTLSSTYTY